MKHSLFLLLLASCSYQADQYFEIQPSPSIDHKLNKLTDDMQRLRRELEGTQSLVIKSMEKK